MSSLYIKKTLEELFSYDVVGVHIDYNLVCVGFKHNGSKNVHVVRILPESLSDMQNTMLVIEDFKEFNKPIKKNIIRRGCA